MTLNKTSLAIALAALLFGGNALADRGGYKHHGASDDIHVDNYVDDGNGNNQWEDSANHTDSYNDKSDNSTVTKNDASNTAKDSFNDKSDNSMVDKSDNSTVNKSDSSQSAKDSFNDESDSSLTRSQNDNSDNSTTDKSDNSTVTRNDAKDSFNTDSSISYKDSFNDSSTTTNTTNNITMDADVVIANSNQMGFVAANNVSNAGSGGFLRRPGGGGAMNLNSTNNLGGLGGAAGITSVAQSAGANNLIQQNVTTNASVLTD
ncbi:dentin sialophosphoprotein precursor [Vibrio ishigakensis]|uniref:Dentin sialophosphoprotein n=1 Tax=Vibrio ishigakensis TaxID=1481914 RepID=A0A0B8PAJ5_9VIBR|nr:dentin sialophosphoprotein precursor [Vibrio ishigakensis]